MPRNDWAEGGAFDASDTSAALPVSPTKALLGVDCPGCGSPRMVYFLLHGDLRAAVTLVLVTDWLAVRNIPFAPLCALHV
ncbi:DUF2752 domain-containing protein [Mycobacterium sp. Lab-001]|uniref:DUF2752 domain-containing protein n=1 Tax=Mycobacterium sp. Lab-001 TaxID=3410136 RepID=UPI003D17A610